MKRIFYIFFMLMGVFAGKGIAQSTASVNNDAPLVILNGKISISERIKEIDSSAIKGMWVFKGKGIQGKYGEAGNNGVVFISTQSAEFQKGDTIANNQPLILLDSVEIDADSLKKILPIDIKEIVVYKDTQATNRYGIKAAKGLVMVTSKKPRLVSFATPAPDGALLLVDGVVTDLKKLEEIKPENIQAINVLRGVESTAVYGSKGSHGVILVTTKSSIKPELFIRDSPSIPDVALLIVDGKIVDIGELPKIDPAQIVKIEVLKGDSATSLGGTRAKHGVILVTTKNNKKTKN